MIFKLYKYFIRLIFSFLLGSTILFAANEQLQQALEKLKLSYPDHIQAVFASYILWTDGTKMPIGNFDNNKTTAEKLENPSLVDQLTQPHYITGIPTENPQTDPGRVRHEPFFRKMYGNSLDEVQNNLISIRWMPKIFWQNTYTLKVTKINNFHEKIERISDDLEELVSRHPEYVEFLNRPGGTFCWRNIANTNRLSAHSFGMTIDINASLSHYWQWDLKKEKRPVDEESELTYRNIIPWEIIEIFEKHGLIWGGKWYHYDTMHFEYRPELIV